MSIGIDFLVEQINGGPLPGHAATPDGWQEPESPSIDAAADEWSRQLDMEQFMESGAELTAINNAMQAEWDRLLACLPANGDVFITRRHEMLSRGELDSSWFVSVYTGRAGKPGVLCGSASHPDSLTAAGDAALADLRLKVNAAVAAAGTLSSVAAVAAEG